MKYYAVDFTITPNSEDFADILSACIADLGFETFETTEKGLVAYIQRKQLVEEELQCYLDTYPIPDVAISYVIEEAPDEDWNQEWEKEGFQPIVIGNIIGVHDVQHEIPEVQYDIVITPRQAFGTGSHQTTRMILTQLSEMDLAGKRVIDAGTGTGILSIMAMKRGASSIFAYDIDEWSVENVKQNLILNGIKHGVDIRLGDASVLKTEKEYNLLIANINRNILLADMECFRGTLVAGGQLILSGFYIEDIPLLVDKAKELGLTLQYERHEEGWAMLLFKSNAAGGMNV